MPCPTCDHTMQGIHITETCKRYWCPRCGTLRQVYSHGWMTDVPTRIDELLDEIAYLKGAIQERDKQAEREAELQDGIRSREQGWG